MTVWGTQFSIAVILFLLTFPIGLWFLTYHHYHRHGTFRGWSATLTTATFLYITGVIAFTLFPFPDEGRSSCIAGEQALSPQLVPFASLSDILEVWQDVGFPAVLASVTFLQVALNVVLLVPLGMLLAYRYKKSFAFTVLFGLGVSLLIEITQGTGVFGLFDCPYRLADVDDLLTNTAGAAIGWLIAAVVMRWLPDPTPEPDADLGRPRVSRRLFSGVLDILTLFFGGIAMRGMLLIVLQPDGGTPESFWLRSTFTLLDVGAVAVVLFLVVPLMREDRATPGQIATWLAVARHDTEETVTTTQIAIRFAVRWLPIAVGAFIQPLAIIFLVAIYEIAAVAFRSDSRSLSDVSSSTRIITKRNLTLPHTNSSRE